MKRILLTNDDGVHSPGLLALQRALVHLGEVVIFAPERNWSAAGHTKTMHKPLRVSQVILADGTRAFATNGAPSDCVGLAMLGVLPQPPDLVISGINQGANVGHDVTYSGTVAGAMEAVVSGLPALAVSVEWSDPIDYEPAAAAAAHLAQEVLARGLPANSFLNINAPALPASAIRGIRRTRLGERIYNDRLIERRDPRGRPYYWIGGEPPGGRPDEAGETDIGALAQGFISVTPLTMDMTDRALLTKLADWGL